MPHVELSLTEDASRLAPTSPGQTRPRTGFSTSTGSVTGNGLDGGAVGSLERWTAAASGATEPCLVLRSDGIILAASSSCAELIGLGDLTTAHGRQLREAVGSLVDFTASPVQLDNAEADKIPPLFAISSGRLARGLMRVVCPGIGQARTMDAIATPLWDGVTVAGSLTFFSEV